MEQDPTLAARLRAALDAIPDDDNDGFCICIELDLPDYAPGHADANCNICDGTGYTNRGT